MHPFICLLLQLPGCPLFSWHWFLSSAVHCENWQKRSHVLSNCKCVQLWRKDNRYTRQAANTYFTHGVCVRSKVSTWNICIPRFTSNVGEKDLQHTFLQKFLQLRRKAVHIALTLHHFLFLLHIFLLLLPFFFFLSTVSSTIFQSQKPISLLPAMARI